MPLGAARFGLTGVADVLDLNNVNLIYSYDIAGTETSVDFLSTDISPDTYENSFFIFNYVGTSIGQAYLDFSTDNCSSFTSNNYSYNSSRGTSASSTPTGDNSTTATYFEKLTYANTGDVAGIINISNMNALKTTRIQSISTAETGSNYSSIFYGGNITSSDSEQYNSFRFGLASGSFDSGNLSVYSYVES